MPVPDFGFAYAVIEGRDVFPHEHKAQLADLVRRGNTESLKAIPAQFVAILDDTFRERHRSLKCMGIVGKRVDAFEHPSDVPRPTL